ncbi:serine hydroxymethyltransferase [Candidatus Parcubacteria bacterium]|nr:MAG: serine hydroxymethyltransferase [Candidatus Parcubacteria bacterium]
MKKTSLGKTDPALARLIRAEAKRQEEMLDLIPSENFASVAVREAVGSVLTNKYSEGYPGKRYYPGNAIVDEIELLAQKRALAAFKLSPDAWAVNVQPYSGSPANIAIYAGLMDIGDTVLGMALAAGGHLTHGHKVNFSGRAWHAVQYGVAVATGRIDYESVRALAERHKPKVIVSGTTAYPRQIDFKKFGAIAKRAKAYHVADISHIAGLVAAGVHPSPFGYADAVMTTTHKSLRGPRGAIIFARKAVADQIDRAVFPGMQGGPHNHVTAGIAAMFAEALRPSFRRYQKQIVKNAQALASGLLSHGFALITGGTDTHLVLADVRPFNLDGMAAERKLEAVGITANRNTIPGDASPFRPSGLRMGTPALTTRGMREKEMREVADLIAETLRGGAAGPIRRRVQKLCKRFPINGNVARR